MRRASGDLERKMIYGKNEIKIPDDSSPTCRASR